MILMIAGAFNFNVFAVKIKSGIGIDSESTESCPLRNAVGFLTFRDDGNGDIVKVRRINIPAVRVAYLEQNTCVLGTAR